MIIQQESSWPLWVLWALLTTTDSLDGYLARRQGTTRSGAFLDPLADKVLSLGGLWAMVIQGRFWWLPVALITVREAFISAFRWYWGRRGLAVQASQIAKFKTFLQFGAVGWVVFPLTTDIDWAVVGLIAVGSTVGGQIGAVAVDRFELVERATGVAETTARDHGHPIPELRPQRRQDQADLVPNAAGAVFVDAGGARRPREGVARLRHRARQL
jgi:CDP-diacylglycerol--glycerol-3-phosphate 3-phosphatidyltransferase